MIRLWPHGRTWILLSMVFWLAVACFIPADFIDLGGDSAQYIIIGESLAQGKGLRLINAPEEPFSTYFPPGLPILLSPVLYIFGRNFFLIHVALALLGFGSLPFLFKLFQHHSNTRAAFAGVILTATNWVFIIYASNYILSDIVYLFFSSAALVFAQGYVASGKSQWRTGLLLAAGLLLSFFTRTAGIVLFLAVLTSLVTQREPGAARKIGFLSLVFVPAALFWYVLEFLSHPGSSHPHIFSAIDPYAPYKGSVFAHPQFLLTRFMDGGNRFFSLLADTTFFLCLKKNLLLRDALCGLVLVIAFFGLWRLIRKNPSSPMHHYFLWYLAAIIFWPYSEFIEGARYLLPVVAFLLFYFLAGVMAIIERFAQKAQSACLSGLVSGLLILNIASLTAASRIYPVQARSVPPPFSRFIELHEWIEKNVASHQVFFSRKPSLTYFYAGRKAVIYPYTLNPEQIWQEAEEKGVRYIIVDEFSAETVRYLLPFLERYRDRINLLYRIGNTGVFEIK